MIKKVWWVGIYGFVVKFCYSYKEFYNFLVGFIDCKLYIMYKI